MNSIFSDIFENIFSKAISPDKSEKKIGGDVSLPPIIKQGQKEMKKWKDTNSDQKKKIEKKLDKKDNIEVDHMVSSRYTTGDGKVSLNEYDGENEEKIPSTAIRKVKYNKDTHECWVQYITSNKWYKFIKMSMQQFMSFMNASSKGRYVQKIMRNINFDPSFGTKKLRQK